MEAAQTMARDDAHDSASGREHGHGGGDLEDDEDEDEDSEEELAGLAEKTRATQPEKKALPKQALEDPVKTVSLLIARLEDTMGGVEALLEHYQIPPLVTAGSDGAVKIWEE